VLVKSHLVSELFLWYERFDYCSIVIIAENFANVDFYVFLMSYVAKLLGF